MANKRVNQSQTGDAFVNECVADGLAIMHRFKPEPSLKHGRPHYASATTVAAVAHAKQKQKR